MSLKLRLPEPGSFEHLLEEYSMPAAALLRLSKFPKTEPYWSRGRARFDGPPSTAAGPSIFGTCYAAEKVEVAFSESVIHESSWFDNGRYQVLATDLTSRHIVTLCRPAKPMLVLADLTGEPLKRLGLNNDISAGDEDDYQITMQWASAIFLADDKWDGIRYVSRQSNGDCAVALFERSAVMKGASRKLEGSELDDLCDRFHVAAI